MKTLASERRRRLRRKAELGVHLLTSMALLDVGAVENGELSFLGTTRDISVEGLCLVLPSVRVDERYFAGKTRQLNVVLNLPTAPVRVQASPVYCRRLAEREPEEGYLIGMRFLEMSEYERARLVTYLCKL
jgi:c-di-GMP-binding flagellar brake protein YcgR